MRFHRLRHLAVLLPLAGVLLGGSAGPASAASDAVTPLLTCVFHNTDGTYSAVFGYKNTLATPVTLAVGTGNNFAPTPADRGQPTVFQSGTVTSAIVINFTGSDLAWNLNTHTVHATSASTPCPASPTLPVSPGSPAGLVFLFGSTAVGAAVLGRRRVRPLLRR